ncbi:hypothetical protein [Weissella confusa]|jgi:hypothetical protein|nr:hypothetical protein [Weissella confusa]MBD5833097.1 hypothetical protein [Weissella confusa]MBF7058246.1 hypothetical protein [Weissella confusa]MBJ7631470.1 hypothetical protein [Weissella confusa]MBJ7635674.1 hypothetical protein [Weissella confusa]MBJ7690649.1 hypothetical protein [Weissella confusa]
MAHLISLVIMWIVIGIYAYESYKAYKARLEYERKAQRAIELVERAIELVEGWRDAYLKVYQINDSKEDDHA